MPGRNIVVIGGSAGAVQGVQEIARGLPADFPGAVFVVIHTSPTSPGILPRLIDNAGPLPADYADDGEPVRFGRIYVARPDHHLLLLGGQVRVARGPKENGFRPAVDPLFRTAAEGYGGGVVGVVLSGGLDDGTRGLRLIKRAGGAAIVQDPLEAVFPGMPHSAIDNVRVDRVLPLAQIAGALVELTGEPVKGAASMTRAAAKKRDDVDLHGTRAMKNGTLTGPPSALTCPECGGALWELAEGDLVHYRCHVGHSFSPDGLVAAQTQDLESALWSALRALEESAELRRRMAQRARQGEMDAIAEAYEGQAAAAEHQADAIRAVLTDQRGNGAFAPPVGAGEMVTTEASRRSRGKSRRAPKAAGKNGRKRRAKDAH